MSRRLCLAVTVFAVAVALCLPTAVHAERWKGSDDAGDVEGWQFDPEPEPCGTYTDVDASANTNQDVTGLVVGHMRRELKLVVQFRDLDRELEQRVAIHVVSGKRRWVLDVSRFRDFDTDVFQVAAFLARAAVRPGGNECGDAVKITPTSCHVRPQIDLRANVLRASVPRSCLRHPRSVRVGVRATGSAESGDAFADHWGVQDAPASSWLPPFGPRVKAPRGAKVGP